MVDALIGRKVGMTQIYTPKGDMIPVTVITAPPCVVMQKKTVEKDGYTAVQLGFDELRPKLANKAQVGHAKASGGKPMRILHEFRGESALEVGKAVTVAVFKAGDRLKVVGKNKGRGFAGGVKRHHFKGGPETHGSMFHRIPGSMGTHTFPGRVIKGKKLPGHMGNKRITVKHVEVIQVDESANVLLVRGPVPGARKSIVYMTKEQG